MYNKIITPDELYIEVRDILKKDYYYILDSIIYNLLDKEWFEDEKDMPFEFNNNVYDIIVAWVNRNPYLVENLINQFGIFKSVKLYNISSFQTTKFIFNDDEIYKNYKELGINLIRVYFDKNYSLEKFIEEDNCILKQYLNQIKTIKKP